MLILYFYVLVKLFLHDGIGDSEIQIPEYFILHDVIVCQELGAVFASI